MESRERGKREWKGKEKNRRDFGEGLKFIMKVLNEKERKVKKEGENVGRERYISNLKELVW